MVPTSHPARRRRLALVAVPVLAASLALEACAVVSVAGTAVSLVGSAAGAAVSVGGAVVSSTVRVAGKAVEKTIDIVTPGPATVAPK